MRRRLQAYAKILSENPRMFCRKALGRIRLAVIPVPEGSAPVTVGEHIIHTRPSRNYWWKSMYLGCCDVEITDNIRRYIEPGATFIDVGAGVGYFSAIASELVGPSGQVHCFEPSPENARAIRTMIESHPNSTITLNPWAAGAHDGLAKYYIRRDPRGTGPSMLQSLLQRADEVIQVRVQRLDTYLIENRLRHVSLIKIDVEGYERFVLQGLERFLESVARKPPIICEIFLDAYAGPGYSLQQLDRYMASQGYQAYSIWNPSVKVELLSLSAATDVVFRPVVEAVP